MTDSFESAMARSCAARWSVRHATYAARHAGAALDNALVLHRYRALRYGVAKVEGGALLPLVCEAVHVDEFGDIVAVVCEESERAACVHGLELGVVADEQDLCSGIRGNPCNAVE